MYKDRIVLGVSAVTLAVAMVVWFDLFAFLKVGYPPRWASFLPTAPFSGTVLAIPFLIPIAFISHSVRAACQGILWTTALSPIPAMIAYALVPAHQHSGLPLNLIVQYSVLALFGCLVPGAVMLGIRIALRKITSEAQ